VLAVAVVTCDEVYVSDRTNAVELETVKVSLFGMVTGVVEAIALVEVCPIETVDVCSNVACCSVDISDSRFVGDEVMEL
jgi:hypothetical protein